MKLEVGMYVRTEYGIAKIKYKTDEYLDCDNTIMKSFGENYFMWDIQRLNILKASHNIIDLIEVGDYVNGREVAYIDEFGKYIAICETDITTRDFEGRYEFKKIKEQDIKSIVTKEQFESMKYSLEG